MNGFTTGTRRVESDPSGVLPCRALPQRQGLLLQRSQDWIGAASVVVPRLPRVFLRLVSLRRHSVLRRSFAVIQIRSAPTSHICAGIQVLHYCLDRCCNVNNLAPLVLQVCSIDGLNRGHCMNGNRMSDEELPPPPNLSRLLPMIGVRCKV